MPMSMKELDRTYRRTYRRLMTGAIIVYGTTLLALVVLLLGNPRIAAWVSEATQAELIGSRAPSAPEPLRLAQPIKPVRTVKAE